MVIWMLMGQWRQPLRHHRSHEDDGMELPRYGPGSRQYQNVLPGQIDSRHEISAL